MRTEKKVYKISRKDDKVGKKLKYMVSTQTYKHEKE